MKRKLTFLSAALVLLTFLAIPLGMRGQTQTTEDVTLSEGSFDTDHITWSCANGNITITQTKGSSTTNVNSSYIGAPRIYKGHILSFAGDNGYMITSISITCNGNYLGNSMTAGTEISGTTVTDNTTDVARTWATTSGGTHVVSSVSDAGLSAIYIQNVATTNVQLRPSAISITYIASGTPAVTHTLTCDVYPPGAGTMIVDGTLVPSDETVYLSLAENQTVDISATANSGYVFDHWAEVTSQGTIADDHASSTTFTMGTADSQLTAVFNQVNTYTVTYHPNVTGTTSIEVTYNEGDDVTVAANTFTNPGYAFTKWNTLEGGTGTDYMPGDVINDIDEDIDLYAQWEQSNDVTDVLNWAATGSPTAYTDWTYTAPSGTAYKGQSSGNASSQYIQLRSNNNNSGIVTTNSIGNATKVVVTWNSATTSGRTLNIYGSNSAYSAATDLYGTNAGDLLGTIVYGTSTELNITESYAYIGMRSASGAMYLDEIDITWTTGGTPVPSITIENNDELAYNATSGSFNFTLNNPVDGGSLSISEDVDWMEEAAINGNASIGYSVTFTTTANEAGTAREGVITLTYTYNTSETVTKNVTVTQAGNPNATMTIAEVRAQGTGSVVTKGVVTHISGVTAYIQDATAAIVVYGSNTPVIGDEIRVEGVLSTYKGLLEIGSNAAAPTVTVLSQGNTVSPTVMTIEAINTDAAGNNDYQAKLVRIEEAVYNNGTVSQGASSITVYGTMTGVSDGDVVNFTANIGCYNSVQLVNLTDIEVQANTEPSVTVTPSTIDAPFDGTDGTLAITYENIPGLYDFDYYFCDAEGNELLDTNPAYPGDWIDAEINEDNGAYSLDYIIDANDGDARTAYLKVYFEEVYAIVTVNQAAYVAPALDYATLPFAFDGGKADIETTDGLTQEGLDTDYASSPKLKFKTAGTWVILHFNETPGTLTFDIKGYTFSGGTFTVQTSEDGVTYTDLQTYTDTNFDNTLHSEQFNNLDENVRYIKWIYTEKSSGNVGLGNIHLYKVGGGPVLDPVINASDITMAYDQTEGSIAYTITNPVTGIALTAATEADWISNVVVTSEAVTFTASENTSTEARTATFTLSYTGATDVTVTVTQAAYEPPFTGATYTLATSIESGRRYIITNGNDKAMGAQSVNATSGAQGNNRTAVGIATVGNVAQVSSADVVEFVINGPDANGRYIIYDPSQVDFHGYLYAASNSSNHLKTRTFNSDANGEWIITFGAENNAVITAQGSNTHNIMRYNSSGLFSCYGEGNNQADVYLYVKDEETPTYTFYKDIAGYGASNLYTNNGYYFVATPVNDIDPVGTGMITDPADYYDLYSFDQSGDEFGNEWINYKDMLHGGGFNLFKGKGYLYANHDNVTLAITGTPTDPTDNVVIPLVVVPNVDWSGKNLVGNPFGQAAYITKPYYRMNPEGNDFIAVEDGGAINPMEGIFVIANVNGEELTFTTTAPASGSKMSLNISGNRGSLIDRAIVRFGEGSLLPKFQLNPDNTKIYFTQAENDYAVVNSDGQGEMPVSFKAAEDGTYTLNINTSNAEMDYLHLLDNLTGADVDLLQTPEYTFDARTTDYASRFRLVFGTTQISEFVEGSASFAYFSNGSWVINNEGDATIQVVDVMGRVLSSETINGCANVNVNAAPGVYMLRLVNGENVKVQKVVVR